MNPIDKPLPPLPNELGFEQWYCENAFDYCKEPIGSRDCSLQRQAWHAALAAERASRPEPAGVVREVASPAIWCAHCGEGTIAGMCREPKPVTIQPPPECAGMRAATKTKVASREGERLSPDREAAELVDFQDWWHTHGEYLRAGGGDYEQCFAWGAWLHRAAAQGAVEREPSGDALDARRWQPIETAPQTGRTILLGYFNVLGKWRTLRGQWFTDAVIQEEWTNSDVHEAGWFETSVECDEEDNGCWPTEPTHWMPLPPAPDAAITAARQEPTL